MGNVTMSLIDIVVQRWRRQQQQHQQLRIYKKSRKDRSQSIPLILELLNGQPTTRNEIIRKSGLKYWKVKEYVSLLILSNPISYNEIDQTYKATAKGLYYLNLYNQMSELLPIIQIYSS
jgi:predicted transcriptional regulator